MLEKEGLLVHRRSFCSSGKRHVPLHQMQAKSNRLPCRWGLCPACANQGHEHAGLQPLVVYPALCADGHGAHHDPATLEDAVRLRTICSHWSPGGGLGAGCHPICYGAGPRKLSLGEEPKGNLGPPQCSWKSENIGVSLFNLI